MNIILTRESEFYEAQLLYTHTPSLMKLPTDNNEVSHLKMVHVMIQRMDTLMTLEYIHGKKIH